MKNQIHFLIIILLTTLVLAGCKKEEQLAKPEIKAFELGYENRGIAYLGADLHIEAEILAPGKIDRVIIEIHHEGDHGKKVFTIKNTSGEEEWEVDTTYTKFYGLKNASFHEHIGIPMWAEVGIYHFHMKVIDQEGNQTIKEADLEIKAPVDHVAPTITTSTKPSGNQTFGSHGSFLQHYPNNVNL